MGPVRQDVSIIGEFSMKALHLHALPVVAAQVGGAQPDAAGIIAAPAVVPLIEA